jgi:hypothetical protein
LQGASFSTYAYGGGNPIGSVDPLGLTARNQAQTWLLLQQAYQSATAGQIQGLLNIYNNSKGNGPYDFGWNASTAGDTWTICGHTLNADQFANYVAGFQGGAYDSAFSLANGQFGQPFIAEGLVEDAGILYHLYGKTKAKNDPLDQTGTPFIHAGEADAW